MCSLHSWSSPGEPRQASCEPICHGECGPGTHASDHNGARSALRALRARARAGERIMAISGYQRAAAALLVGTEPNFVTWGDYGPENRTSPRAPTPRSLHSAARCARRTALERASSCCTFAKNKRQSRVQLTQHAARKPRMRCWGYCGRELEYFEGLAYLD